jgi:hypothetical protein
VSGAALFRWSAGAALVVHALLLLGDGLHGGGDMKPHLRLIQLMGETPALRNVYAPAYHAIGALLAPMSGLAAYPEWFAWGSMAALIAAFRRFQRVARLPDACAALFAWAPYHFALTTCLPKVEVAGYAVALLGLSLLLERRHVALALCLALAFAVHTAAALFLGLTGGVLALSLGDRRALGALGAGTLLALPLPLAHLAAGCSLGEALLFSQGDYLRAAPRLANWVHWDRILILANPIVLVAAGIGSRALWRDHRPVAFVCAVIAVLYLNEIWLAPFDARTTLDLLRGLTVLAIPVAVAAGLAVGSRPRLATGAVAASAIVALASIFWITPGTCVSKPIDLAEISHFDVDRCQFRWRPRRLDSGRGAEAPEVRLNRGVERPAPLEGPPQ